MTVSVFLSFRRSSDTCVDRITIISLVFYGVVDRCRERDALLDIANRLCFIGRRCLKGDLDCIRSRKQLAIIGNKMGRDRCRIKPAVECIRLIVAGGLIQ